MLSSIKARNAVVALTIATAGMAAGASAAAASTVSPADACPVTSAYGHPGKMICGTLEQFFQGQDVVIGSDFSVYLDDGSGWRHLGNGKATNNRSSDKLGVFWDGANTIQILGTDYYYYCIAYTGGWNSWYQCGHE